MAEQQQKVKIEDLIRSPDPKQRLRAVALLLRSGQLNALPFLERFSNSDPDNEVRFYSRRAVAEFRKKIESEKATSIDTTLGSSTPNASPRERVRTTLLGDDPVRVQKALRAIAVAKDVTIVSDLLTVLQRSSIADVRAATVTVLGLLATPEAIQGVESALHDSDHRVVANSVEVIGRLRPKEDLALLIPFLQDGDGRVQANAARCLMQSWPGDALKTLREMLQSEDLGYRASAAFACSTISHEAIVPLLEMATRDRDPGVRAQGLKGLKKLASKGIQQAQDALTAFDPSGELQKQHETGRIEPQLEVGVTLVREGLASPDANVRLQTAFSATQDENRAAFPFLLAALASEGDGRVRATLVSAVAALGQPDEVVRALLPLLQDPEPRVRANTIEGLARHVDNPGVISAIEPLLHHENRRCRGNAILALRQRLGARAYEQVAELVASTDPLTRKTALFCLDELAGDEGIPSLALLAGDPDASIRRRALEVLDHLAANGSKKAALARIDAREIASKAATWKESAEQAAEVGENVAARLRGILTRIAKAGNPISARRSFGPTRAAAETGATPSRGTHSSKRAKTCVSVVAPAIEAIIAQNCIPPPGNLPSGRSARQMALAIIAVAIATYSLTSGPIRARSPAKLASETPSTARSNPNRVPPSTTDPGPPPSLEELGMDSARLAALKPDLIDYFRPYLPSSLPHQATAVYVPRSHTSDGRDRTQAELDYILRMGHSSGPCRDDWLEPMRQIQSLASQRPSDPRPQLYLVRACENRFAFLTRCTPADKMALTKTAETAISSLIKVSQINPPGTYVDTLIGRWILIRATVEEPAVAKVSRSQALEHFRRGYDLISRTSDAPDAIVDETYHWLGVLLVLHGQNAEALAVFRKFAQLAGQLQMSHFCIGALLDAKDDYEGAGREYEMALRDLGDDFPEFSKRVSKCLTRVTETKRVRAILDTLARNPTDEDAAIDLGMFLITRQEKDKQELGKVWLRRAFSKSPNPIACFAKVKATASKSEATSVLEKVRLLWAQESVVASSDLSVVLEASRILLTLGDHADRKTAIKSLRKVRAVKIDRDSRQLLGRLHWANGDIDEAVEEFRTTLTCEELCELCGQKIDQAAQEQAEHMASLLTSVGSGGVSAITAARLAKLSQAAANNYHRKISGSAAAAHQRLQRLSSNASGSNSNKCPDVCLSILRELNAALAKASESARADFEYISGLEAK